MGVEGQDLREQGSQKVRVAISKSGKGLVGKGIDEPCRPERAVDECSQVFLIEGHGLAEKGGCRIEIESEKGLFPL